MAWRDTANYPKFFQFDAISVLPLAPTFLHFKLWTVSVAVIVMLFFVYLNQRGTTMAAFFRFIILFLAGKERTKMRSRVWRRRLRD